jgi:hypothetical protein
MVDALCAHGSAGGDDIAAFVAFALPGDTSRRCDGQQNRKTRPDRDAFADAVPTGLTHIPARLHRTGGGKLVISKGRTHS